MQKHTSSSSACGVTARPSLSISCVRERVLLDNMSKKANVTPLHVRIYTKFHTSAPLTLKVDIYNIARRSVQHHTAASISHTQARRITQEPNGGVKMTHSGETDFTWTVSLQAHVHAFQNKLNLHFHKEISVLANSRFCVSLGMKCCI